MHECCCAPLLFLKSRCPSAKIMLLAICIAQLLLCAGDVESNPGPDERLDKILATLGDVIASNKTYQTQTSAKLEQISSGITDISQRVTKLEERFCEVTCLSEEVKSFGVTVTKLKTDMRTFTEKQRETESLVDVVDDLNNRLRRNNLIVKGLPEQESETWADTEEKVQAFFSTHLNVRVGEIERAHRLGPRKPGFSRPIIIKFLNYKSKSEIIGNAHKLRNLASPKIWVEDDFSPKMQFIRKQLRDFARANKGESRYRLSYDKLFLNDNVYKYDSASGQVLPSYQNNRPSNTANKRPFQNEPN